MNFFLEQLINGINLGFAYALIALGFSLVFGVMRVVNFAHGDILMLSGFVGMGAIAVTEHNFALGALTAVAVGGATSLIVYSAFIRPVMGRSFIAPFVTTIGASMVIQAFARQTWGADPLTFAPTLVNKPASIGPVFLSSTHIIVAATAIATMLLLGALLYRTRVGLLLRAASQSPEVARASGINTVVVAALAMVVAGILVGIAAAQLGFAFGAISVLSGSSYGLKGMVVMVIGGIGSLRGSVIAGVIIGMGEVIASAYVSSSWRDAIAFGVLIAVLIVRPAGFFGRKGEEIYVSTPA